MTYEREPDDYDREEAIDQRRAWRRMTQCRCGNGSDMPGSCPGPAFCPYAHDHTEDAA